MTWQKKEKEKERVKKVSSNEFINLMGFILPLMGEGVEATSQLLASKIFFSITKVTKSTVGGILRSISIN